MRHHISHAKTNVPAKQKAPLPQIRVSCQEEKTRSRYLASQKAWPQAIDTKKVVMLASSFRLRASADIERVTRAGKRLVVPIATIYLLSPSPSGHTRIACVAGKRVHKSSVVRHAVQRKLRAACRTLPLDLKDSYDMVIIASRADIRTMKQEEIKSTLFNAIASSHRP